MPCGASVLDTEPPDRPQPRSRMERTAFIAAGINGFLSVALGAFGAHGLKSRLADASDAAQRLGWWETASQYQMAHALALGLVAYLAGRLQAGGVGGSTAASVAGYAFLAGILVFSGSLYAMTLTGTRALGAITPLGGLCFLVGWAAVVAAALKLP